MSPCIHRVEAKPKFNLDRSPGRRGGRVAEAPHDRRRRLRPRRLLLLRRRLGLTGVNSIGSVWFSGHFYTFGPLLRMPFIGKFCCLGRSSFHFNYGSVRTALVLVYIGLHKRRHRYVHSCHSAQARPWARQVIYIVSPPMHAL